MLCRHRSGKGDFQVDRQTKKGTPSPGWVTPLWHCALRGLCFSLWAAEPVRIVRKEKDPLCSGGNFSYIFTFPSLANTGYQSLVVGWQQIPSLIPRFPLTQTLFHEERLVHQENYMTVFEVFLVCEAGKNKIVFNGLLSLMWLTEDNFPVLWLGRWYIWRNRIENLGK